MYEQIMFVYKYNKEVIKVIQNEFIVLDVVWLNCGIINFCDNLCCNCACFVFVNVQ